MLAVCWKVFFILLEWTIGMLIFHGPTPIELGLDGRVVDVVVVMRGCSGSLFDFELEGLACV